MNQPFRVRKLGKKADFNSFKIETEKLSDTRNCKKPISKL